MRYIKLKWSIFIMDYFFAYITFEKMTFVFKFVAATLNALKTLSRASVPSITRPSRFGGLFFECHEIHIL